MHILVPLKLFILFTFRIFIWSCCPVGKSVICKGSNQPMQDCDHEEADTRICIHLHNSLERGAHNILVSIVDTDVIVLLISVYFQLNDAFSEFNVWVRFGTGNHMKFYDINSICEHLGEVKSKGLPFFHAFSGCDTTLQFLERGKNSAWEAWKAYPDVSEAFLFPLEHPYYILQLGSSEMKLIERYVCVLYDKTTSLCTVNELRKELFCKHSKTMETIPPTQVIL